MPDRAVVFDDWYCSKCKSTWVMPRGIPGWVGHCPDCEAMMERVKEDTHA